MTLKRMNNRRHGDGQPNRMINYTAMIDAIVGVDTLGERSTLFLSNPPRNLKRYMSDSDLDSFVQRGFQVKCYDLRDRRVDCYSCERYFTIYQEKPVDAAIIVAMFKSALRAGADEELVLVSGDGDFAEAAEEVTNESGGYGVRLSVWGFSDSTASYFQENPAFSLRYLNEFLQDEPVRRMTTRRHRRSERDWPRTRM